MQDADLVRSILAGEEGAFEVLLDEFQPRVYRLACRLVSPREADDVTQEVFIAVFKGLKRFRGESSLSTWLYRVAFNTCQTYRLREARRPRLPIPETPDLRQAVLSAVENCDVAEAVAKLDDRHRVVLVLHELHGLTYGEIAEVIQVPVGTVKSRLSNALHKLREMLRDRPAEAV
jgi:RNA polymerase sigma-70 factor (ECF subfamily)